ncbi:host specificity protein J [Thalassovita sp.]|uniref:host specificity protein J n=1 Tax=Thalassovita sp. TaxID=1979401 RepID=UPI002AB20F13|nr:phage tail protein [Thalassovita sp.]
MGVVSPVTGRKKGGGGGKVVEDNLLTDSTAYILGLVSEGEIEGLANSDDPEQCIFLDDVPLRNADGSYNFEGISWAFYTGTATQPAMPGFAAVRNEVGVNAKVEQANPIERTVTTAEIDAVSVKVSTPAMMRLTSKGDRLESEVAFRIEMQVGAAAAVTVKSDIISGKTTSGYQRGYRIELPQERPVTIRVVRETPDAENENTQNAIYFASLTEIVDAKLSYPHCALLGLAVPAKAVGGSVQKITVKVRGMKCLIPSNYDPVARTYDESTMWDGTFKVAWTRCPIWALYTTFVQDRWGLGQHVSASMFDKWTAYQIGKYCDELVPDGSGGMEPRFSIDGEMSNREAAFAWITRISAAFRGTTYWGAGAIVPVQDAPAAPVRLVTNSDVAGGAFRYSGTPKASRHTTAVVTLQDTTDHHRMKALIAYDDPDAIERYGERLKEITAPFMSSVGEGLRAAKWAVDTDTTQKEMVSYEAGFSHQAIRPGNIVMVSDKNRVGVRLAGRIAALSMHVGGSLITLDAPVSLEPEDYNSIIVSDDLGATHELEVLSAGDDIKTLQLAGSLPENVVPGGRFAVQTVFVKPRQYRVLRNKPDQKKTTFEITAVEHDPAKFLRVEQGISIDADPGHLLPTISAPTAPAGLSLQAYLKPRPGSESQLMLEASWQQSDNPLVSQYAIATRSVGGSWKIRPSVDESNIEWPADKLASGRYEIKVAAVSQLGQRSPFASAFVDFDLLSVVAPSPEGWGGNPGHDTITLFGPEYEAASFKAFAIYGATAVSDDLVLLDTVTATRYVRSVPPGDAFTRYKIAAITHDGLESDPGPFIDLVPQPSGLDDLAPDVRQEIDAAAYQALQVGSEIDALLSGFAGGTLQGALDTQQAALRAEMETAASVAPVDDFRDDASHWAGGFVFGVEDAKTAPSIVDAYAETSVVSVAEEGEVLQGDGVYRVFSERVRRPFVEGQKIRVRIRTRLVQDPAPDAGNHVHRLYIVGVDSGGNYSHYVSPAAYYQLSVSDGWVVREVTFDPWEIRSTTTNTTFANSVGWGLMPTLNGPDSNVGGAVQQIAWVKIEDVTDTEQLSADLENNYYTLAQTDTAIAASETTLRSEIASASASVLSSDFFEAGTYYNWVTAATVTANEQFDVGSTLSWDISSDTNAGIYFRSDIAAQWKPSGMENADAYEVEVVFELVSGDIAGAGVLFDWRDVNNALKRTAVPLNRYVEPSLAAIPGKIYTARILMERPEWNLAAFAKNQIYLMANYQYVDDGIGRTAKHIKFHKFSAQPVSSIHAEVTEQRASIAELEGSARAAYVLRAAAGGSAADFEMVAWDDADGNDAGSLIRLNADNIIAKGTLSTDKLAVGLPTQNMIPDPMFLNPSLYNTRWISGGTNVSYRSTGTWRPSNGAALQLYSPVTGDKAGGLIANAYFYPVLGERFPVKAGNLYEFSAQFSVHRATGQMIVEWYDEDGNWLAWNKFADLGELGLPIWGGTSSDPEGVDNWPRYGAILEAPAGAAFARPRVEMLGVHGSSTLSDGWVFAHGPVFRQAFSADEPLSSIDTRGVTYIDGGNVIAKTITSQQIDTLEFRSAGLATFGGAIMSANFDGTVDAAGNLLTRGTQGFAITQQGDAVFTNLIARDDIQVGAVSNGVTYASEVAQILQIDQEIFRYSLGAFTSGEFWNIACKTTWRGLGTRAEQDNEGDWHTRKYKTGIKLQWRQRNGASWTGWDTIHTFSKTDSSSWRTDDVVVTKLGAFDEVEVRAVVYGDLGPRLPGSNQGSVRTNVKDVSLYARAIVR